jgi:diadenosine tetraphosphate (Ap4A) HIT family hydrolase
MTSAADSAVCELCTPADVLLENELAYVRFDSNSLSRAHVLVIPRRHVASFFDMTTEEQSAVLVLLNQAQRIIQRNHSPDGYNIGVNIAKAGGQSRMHVHMHLIPRYAGDVPDPNGGIRCVLPKRAHGAQPSVTLHRPRRKRRGAERDRPAPEETVS